MRDSFVFYRSFYEAIKDLPDDQFAECARTIMAYALNDQEPDRDGIAQVVFQLAKPQIDTNNKRFENGRKGGRPTNKSKAESEESAKARHSTDYLKWRDKVYERDGYKCVCCGSEDDIQAHHIKDFDEYPELRYDVSNGVTLCRNCHNLVHNGNNQEKTKINQAITKNKPNVNVNDNDKKESTLSGTKEKRFAPPTPDKVREYCAEKGYAVDADRFCDFYASKNWMVGKNKMKDWKAAVRNWARSEKEERQEKATKPNKFNNFSNDSYGDIDELERKLLMGG